MPNPEHIDLHFKQQALERYRRFERIPLVELMTPAPVFRHVAEDRLNFLLSNQEGVHQWFQQNITSSSGKRTLEFFVSHTLDHLYLHNQFLDIPELSRHTLEAIYRRFIQDYQAAVYVSKDTDRLREALDTVLADHQTRLARFVREIGGYNGGLDFVLTEPVCSLYSPEFQIDLLGFRIHMLLEPILDLGCGQDARLVRFLRDAGKEAYGVDRGAEDTPATFKLDWFEFPVWARGWGTVVSHMAFSVHFMHHHLRPTGHHEEYAKYYMAVLRSLKIGGRFIYTPGLPFFESLLPPDQYQVQRYGIDQPDLLQAYTETMLGDVSYTAVVTRWR